MDIVIYTPVEGLADRWSKILGSKYVILHAQDMAELEKLLLRVHSELLVLHEKGLPYEKITVLRQKSPASRFFVLSDRPDEAKGLALLQLGVVGFGNSYMAEERLLAAVEVLLSGSVWMNQKIMQKLIMSLNVGERVEDFSVKMDAPDGPLAMLSNREFQIAQLVARGFSNMEIGAELGIVERTVKAHLSSIFSKVGVRGRLSLALLVNDFIGRER